MPLSDDSLDRLIRDEIDRSLPLGFAERVAVIAMTTDPNPFWSLLLRLSGRATIALTGVSAVLLAIGLLGDGPGLIEAVNDYVASFDPLALL